MEEDKNIYSAKGKTSDKQNSIPQSPQEAFDYGRSIGLTDQDVEHWWHHHEARGWILSNKQKVKNWKSALQTWKRNKNTYAGTRAQTAEADRDQFPYRDANGDLRAPDGRLVKDIEREKLKRA
jgi:hypothetical protein